MERPTGKQVECALDLISPPRLFVLCLYLTLCHQPDLFRCRRVILTHHWWCTDEKGAWNVLHSFYRAMGGIGHTCWQVCPLASSRCVQGSGAAVVGFTGQVSPEDFFITIEVQPLNPRFRGWTLNKVAYILLQWTRSMLGTNDETTPPQKTKLFAYVNSWKSKTNQPKKKYTTLFFFIMLGQMQKISHFWAQVEKNPKCQLVHFCVELFYYRISWLNTNHQGPVVWKLITFTVV